MFDLILIPIIATDSNGDTALLVRTIPDRIKVCFIVLWKALYVTCWRNSIILALQFAHKLRQQLFVSSFIAYHTKCAPAIPNFLYVQQTFPSDSAFQYLYTRMNTSHHMISFDTHAITVHDASAIHLHTRRQNRENKESRRESSTAVAMPCYSTTRGGGSENLQSCSSSTAQWLKVRRGTSALLFFQA